MKINWKVRIKNEMFWVGFVPLLLMIVTEVAQLFGVELDLANLSDQLVSIIRLVFGALMMLGIVVDPTTPHASDSDRAMGYVKPGVTEEK